MNASNISCVEFYRNQLLELDAQNISFENPFERYPYQGTKQIWITPDHAGYIKIFAYSVIIVAGLLGNLSVILTVALVKPIRNTINYYVANLAVTDAMICIVCMLPHALEIFTENKFVLGEFMCKFIPFTRMTCLTASVLTLSSISCDRFMAVFRPLEVRTTEKRIGVILMAIWITSVTVSIPFLIVKKHGVIKFADFSEPQCYEHWPVTNYRDETTNKCESKAYYRQIYYMFICLTLYFVPVFIMSTTYILIMCKLWTSRIPGERCEANIQAQLRSRHKVLKMIIVVLIVFIICWTPFQVIVFVSAFGLFETIVLPDWFVEFRWFSLFIAYANSFLNPFIYGQYNKEFREGFWLMIQCGTRNRTMGRCCGGNIFMRTMRTMSITFSSVRSGTHAFICKTKSKSLSTQATSV